MGVFPPTRPYDAVMVIEKPYAVALFRNAVRTPRPNASTAFSALRSAGMATRRTDEVIASGHHADSLLHRGRRPASVPLMSVCLTSPTSIVDLEAAPAV